MDTTSLVLDALCRRDPVLARRLDVLRLIDDRGPIDAETILSDLGRGRFGARPSQALARDIRFLRDAGIDIRHQRRQPAGYYVSHVDPELVHLFSTALDPLDPQQVQILRSMSPAERMRSAAADYAFARRVSLTTELRLHPELTLEEAKRRVARKFAGLPEVLL